MNCALPRSDKDGNAAEKKLEPEAKEGNSVSWFSFFALPWFCFGAVDTPTFGDAVDSIISGGTIFFYSFTNSFVFFA